jgi:uncharacterized protein YndB with AHSA1/START domain
MLKWILGGCLALVILACVAIWAGYRQLKKFAAEGPSTSIMIAATPQRVFASLANADSLTDWRTEGPGITASHHGPLVVGDTLSIETRNNRGTRMLWIVTAVARDTAIAYEATMTGGGAPRGLFTRRDSVIARADSTQVISTFGTTMMESVIDSARAKGRDVGPVGQGVLGMASTAMIAGMRVQSGAELGKLKARIEGKAAIPARGTPKG